MKFYIPNEYNELVTVAVCWGGSIPDYLDYQAVHPEFTKYCHLPWNKDLFIQQQQSFFDVLQKHKVQLHLIEPAVNLPWLAYTRDFGFVIKDKLFYNSKRGLPERNGEIEHVLQGFEHYSHNDVIKICAGTIEGGDVLVDDEVTYIGMGSRSNIEAINQLREYTEVKSLDLGENVMHLDTRMTILPNRKLLIYTPAFNRSDLHYLSERFDFIEVDKAECDSLGTNVFVVNPQTIIVHAGHKRIAQALEDNGFGVEVIDYSQPIAISGSFRCTTFPIERKK